MKANIEINALKPDPVFAGTVLVNDKPMAAGKVQLYKYSNTSGAFLMLGETNIQSNGRYNITGIQAGSYIVSVDPDSVMYPNTIKTYYSYKKKWKEADTIVAYCDSLKEIDLMVVELPVQDGSGTIKGKIFNSTNGKRTSEPIPGIDVSLEEEPDTKVVSQTTTDKDGFFSFESVPQGKYKIYVDVPGLDMVNTYEVSITAEDTAVSDNTFFVDSTGTIDIVAPAFIEKIKMQNGNVLKAYPNPYKNYTNIEYSIIERSKVSLEVYNIIGKKIATLEDNTKDAGVYKTRFSAKEMGYASGVYMLRLSINNIVITQSLMENE